jgi:hypothetical protein
VNYTVRSLQQQQQQQHHHHQSVLAVFCMTQRTVTPCFTRCELCQQQQQQQQQQL